MFNSIYVLVIDLGVNLEKIKSVTIESNTVHTIVLDCYKIDKEDLYAVDEFVCNSILKATMPNLKTIQFRGIKACLATNIEWDFLCIDPTIEIKIQKMCRCVS